MHQKKNPVHRNEAFSCKNCGKKNEKAEVSCRNHCRFCLYSLHVDAQIPGDRQSECHGLMEPLAARISPKKEWQILHECTVCQGKKWNMAASDDNLETLSRVIQRGNIDNSA